MKLSIYSLKKILFAGEASLLNCKTLIGEITVLDNHQTYIGVLTRGVMKVVERQPASAFGMTKSTSGETKSAKSSGEARDHFFEINSGFLEVRHGNEVRCIVEQ